jgi:hypothetical protein
MGWLVLIGIRSETGGSSRIREPQKVFQKSSKNLLTKLAYPVMMAFSHLSDLGSGQAMERCNALGRR